MSPPRKSPLRIAVIAFAGLTAHVARRIPLSARARLWLRRLIAGSALLVAAALAVYAWLVYSSGRRVEALLERVRAANEPLSAAALVPPPVPADENAAPLYMKAIALRFEEPEVEPPQKASWVHIDDAMAGRPYDRAALEKLLASNAECLARLDEAVRRPRCRFDARYDDGFLAELPHLLGLKALRELLQVRAIVLTAAGRGDDALGAVRDQVAIVEAYEGERFLISNLVQIAIEGMMLADVEHVLAGAEPGAEACRAFVARLRPLPGPKASLPILFTERWIAVDALRRWRNGDEKIRGMFSGKDGTSPGLDSGWLLNRSEAAFLEGMERIIAAARTDDDATVLAESEAVGRSQSTMQLPLLDAYHAYFQRRILHRASREVARTALALRLHRLEKGSYPASLDALVPSHLAAAPRDPFDGAALRYKLEGKGFVVWSVGKDRKDQGGANSSDGREDHPVDADDVRVRVGR